MPSRPVSQARHTAFVLAVALGLRTAVAWHALAHFHAAWFYSRGTEMGFLGEAIVHGKGLSSPFGVPTGPTAIIAPGYPLLVAAIFRVLGCYSLPSACVLVGINVLLNVCCVWLVLTLARQIATEAAALCSGVFWACFPPLLWIPTIFWETSFSAIFLIGAVTMLCRPPRAKEARFWTAFGAGTGVAGLFNPALLPTLVGMACLYLFHNRRRPQNLLVFVCALSFIYAPWPIRNIRVFHAWIPMRSTVGFELWMGNHDGSQGFLDQTAFPTYNRTELGEYLARGEVGYMTHKETLAMRFIDSHRQASLRLSCSRVFRFWVGCGSQIGSFWYVLGAVLTTSFAFVGIVLLRRSDGAVKLQILLLPLVIFPIPYYVTHAEFRYRLVLDPLLTALGARALDHLLSRPAARTKWSLAPEI